MIKETVAHVLILLYLAGVFVLWFFSTDYLGEVPAKIADEFGLVELKDEIRSHFYRNYIFSVP